MSSYLLRLFGGIRLEVDGQPVQGKAAHRRRLAILALLTAAPSRSLTRERVIAYLWPEASGDGGRRLLSEALYVLRRELGERTLTSVGDELLLDTERLPSDLGAFRHAVEAGDLEAAVALYQGPFLDGWYLADAPDFDRWMEEEREALARAHRDVLLRLTERHEAAGEWPSAIIRLSEVVRLDRFSTQHALRLARIQAAVGERAAALRTLNAHASILRAELEVEPGAELLDEVLRLRSQPPSDAPGPRGPVLPSPPAPVATTALPPAIAPASGAVPAAAAPVEDDAAPAASRNGQVMGPRRMLGRLSGAGIAAMALLSAVGLGLRWGQSDRIEPSPEWRHRVAVMYLDYSGSADSLRYIAEDLTGEIINQLSVNAFDIVSASEAKAVRDGRLSLDSLIASEEVGTLVEGRIRRSEGQLRVTVRLSDTHTAEQLATGTFIQPPSELFTLEREVTRFVADALAQHLRREILLREADAGTRDQLARKLVLLARRRREDATSMAATGHHLDREAAIGALDGADSLLVRAEREDPRWLRPLIERGFVARDRARLTTGPERRRVIESGLALAEQALRRAPRDAAALELRGTLRWLTVTALAGAAADTASLAAADRDLRSAVDLEPNRATAWLALSLVQAVRGQSAAARISAARALEADAFLAESQDLYFGLFVGALTSDSLAAAERWCRRGRLTHTADPRFVECELTLMRERSRVKPDPDSAWVLVARLDSMSAQVPTTASRAYAPVYRRMAAAAVSARAGDRARAIQEIARARRVAAGVESLELDLAFDEAYIRLALGERDEAIQLLRRVVLARPLMRRVIERAPLFRELRDDLNGSPARS